MLNRPKLSLSKFFANAAIILVLLNASIIGPSYAVSTEAIALNNAGVDALKAKNYRVALEKFLGALQLEPGYTVARDNLGVTLNNIGIQKPLEQALPYFHRSLYVRPGAPNVVRNLRNTIDALEMDPAKFEDRIKLADKALAAKDYAGAIVEFEDALKIRDDAKVRQRLAEVPKPVDLPLPAGASAGSASNASSTTDGSSSAAVAGATAQPAVQPAKPSSTVQPSSADLQSGVSSGAVQSTATDRQAPAPSDAVQQPSPDRQSLVPSAAVQSTSLAPQSPVPSAVQSSAVGQSQAGPADQAGDLSGKPVMDRSQARSYLLGLINKDRMANGLNAVQMDETATNAGQMQTDDEAAKHYMSHWNTQGKKPPQRYTECGGADYVAENASGATSLPDGFEACDPPLFDRSALDACHARMMGEVPPHDGHRRNILDPAHTHVGLGLSSVQHRQYAHRMAYIAEEFINRRGTYSALPRELKRGTIEFTGTFEPGYNLQSIQIKSEPLPRTSKPQGGGYSLPDTLVENIFPGRTPDEGESSVRVEGQSFTCTLNVSESWKPGLYYVLIWATREDQKEPVPVSLRAIPLYK